MDNTALFLGLTVEYVGNEAGKVGYRLHGPRATYTLMRQRTHKEIMFALNSKGNVSAVRGNYTFTDRKGELDVVQGI